MLIETVSVPMRRWLLINIRHRDTENTEVKIRASQINCHRGTENTEIEVKELA
jgi:hypothetical protein